ncbi:protein of unknown function [Aminobacter niigataensis]|nr:protein of unknown function [Aminobacter niigataensis]
MLPPPVPDPTHLGAFFDKKFRTPKVTQRKCIAAKISPQRDFPLNGASATYFANDKKSR